MGEILKSQLPKYFDCIIGISGTVDKLSQFKKQFIV